MNLRSNEIYFANAVTVGGIAVAWAYCNPSSALSYLASAVASVFAGAFCSRTALNVYRYFDKWCHRSARGIALDPNGEVYQNALRAAFDKIKNHVRYETFKKIKGLQNNEEAYALHKGLLQGGYCNGMTKCLERLALENPYFSGTELLEKVNWTDVFYFQLLHHVEAYFQARSVTACFGVAFCSKRKALAQKWEKELEEVTPALTDVENDLSPGQMLESSSVSAKAPPQMYQSTLENLLRSKLSSDKEVVGEVVIVIDGLRKKGHVIFFQYGSERFRFYDPFDADGCYEYSEKDPFFASLQTKILDGFLSDFKNKNAEIYFRVIPRTQ